MIIYLIELEINICIDARSSYSFNHIKTNKFILLIKKAKRPLVGNNLFSGWQLKLSQMDIFLNCTFSAKFLAQIMEIWREKAAVVPGGARFAKNCNIL